MRKVSKLYERLAGINMNNSNSSKRERIKKIGDVATRGRRDSERVNACMKMFHYGPAAVSYTRHNTGACVWLCVCVCVRADECVIYKRM